MAASIICFFFVSTISFCTCYFINPPIFKNVLWVFKDIDSYYLLSNKTMHKYSRVCRKKGDQKKIRNHKF